MKEESTNFTTRKENSEPPSIFIIEVGSLLNYLLKGKAGNHFFSEINRIWDSLEKEWGFTLPQYLLKENPLINERTYRFMYREKELVRSQVHPGKTLVIASKEKLGRIPGKIDDDPIYRKPCVWVEPGETLNLQTGDPFMASIDNLIIQHLEMVLRSYARELITIDLIRKKITDINLSNPDLVHSVLTKINLNYLVSVMKNLIPEGIPLTDIAEIMNAMANIEVTRNQTPDRMTEILRKIFRDKLHEHAFGDRLLLFTLPGNKLQLWFHTRSKSNKLDEKDPIVRNFIEELTNLYISFQSKGFRLGVICAAPVRLILRRLLEKHLPDVVVMKPGEIDPDKDILVIKKIESKGVKLWANWQWFWLTAKSPEKQYFKDSFRNLMEYLKKRKEKYIAGRAKHSSGIQQEEVIFQQASPREIGRNLPAVANFTLKQKIAIYLMDCSSEFLREVMAKLDSKSIALLSREMARLPREILRFKYDLLKDVPVFLGIDHSVEHIAQYINSSLNDEIHPLEMTPLYKLAVLISTLSPGTSDLIYKHLLKKLSREDLGDLVLEVQDYKIRSTSHLKVSIVEDFIWYYRGAFSPVVLYSQKHWQDEARRIALREPKKTAMALRDLWLDGSVLLERFEKFVKSDPERAAFWIRKYISSKKENNQKLLLIEKAISLTRLLPPEIREETINNMDKGWSWVFKHLPLSAPATPQESWTVLTQFLSYYYSNFEAGKYTRTFSN